VQCVATHLVAVAKQLPPDHYFHERADIMQAELAPADPAVAAAYLIDQNPHPLPWEQVHYLMRAGRLDRALEIARADADPDARIGGMIEVANRLAQAKDAERTAQLLAEVEPDLPSVADSNYSHAASAAEAWVRIGQPNRAVRVLAENHRDALHPFLDIAKRNPEVAADFRQRAWVQAERAADPISWSLILQDATARADADTTARAAQRALAAADKADPEHRVRIVEALLKVGRRAQASEVIKSWRGWTAQANAVEYRNVARGLVLALAELGHDDEIEAVAGKVAGTFAQSGVYGVAADKLFAFGRSSQAARFEARAIEIAVTAPYENPQQRWERDGAVHNLVLMRSRRGDARGAIELASQINEKREREVMFYVVETTMPRGDQAATLLTIEQLIRLGRASGDPDTLIKAATAMAVLDRRVPALFLRAEALERYPHGASLDRLALAELTWRLEQDVPAALAHLGAKPGEAVVANFARRLSVLHPAAALQVAGGLTDPAEQMGALLTIAEVLSAANRK
jgi:hypothetical protein